MLKGNISDPNGIRSCIPEEYFDLKTQNTYSMYVSFMKCFFKQNLE